MSEYKEEFFLGANTSSGFLSLYNQLIENKKYKKIFIIKGGPGTGKSTIMKRIGEHFSNFQIEYDYCSSDPNSLDVVTIKDLGVSVLDGTPPHPIEPKLPGAFESIVNLYPFFDEKSLSNLREEIETVSKKCSACHEKTVRYISIASILSNSNITIQEKAVEKSKINIFTDRLIKKVLPKKSKSEGIETIRFLSAITPQGVYKYDSMIKKYRDVYVIEDEYGTISTLILERIKNALIENRYSFITCYCVLDPFKKIEHILVPEINVAFITSNSFHKFETVDGYHVINTKRFINSEVDKENKKKLKFNNAVKKEMINQAVKSMIEAKKNHDELEKLYTSNVNFEDMDTLINELIRKIES